MCGKSLPRGEMEKPKEGRGMPTGLVSQKNIDQFVLRLGEGCVLHKFKYGQKVFPDCAYLYARHQKCHTGQEHYVGRAVRFRAMGKVRWEVTGVPRGPNKRGAQWPGGCYYNLRCCCTEACKDSATPTTASGVHQIYLVHD